MIFSYRRVTGNHGQLPRAGAQRAQRACVRGTWHATKGARGSVEMPRKGATFIDLSIAMSYRCSYVAVIYQL